MRTLYFALNVNPFSFVLHHIVFYHKLVETLHVVSEFIQRVNAITQMNDATFGTSFLTSFWPALINKTDKDIQKWTETDWDTQTELV